MGGNLRPELERILREAGCSFVRPGRGDHAIWFSPISQQRFPVDSKIDFRLAEVPAPKKPKKA